MHCPDGPLCGECLAELLASHVVPDLPWVESLDEESEPIVKRVRSLSRDERIARELALICARAARSRWESLREARMK